MEAEKKPISLSVMVEAAKLDPDTFNVLEIKQELTTVLISQLFKDLVQIQSELNQLKKENKNEDASSL